MRDHFWLRIYRNQYYFNFTRGFMKTYIKQNKSRGMVTIELAIGLLSVVTITVFMFWIVQLGVVQAKCVDTATQVARQLARGDKAAAKKAMAAKPAGAKVITSRTAKEIRVEVLVSKKYLGIAVPISGTANYMTEAAT